MPNRTPAEIAKDLVDTVKSKKAKYAADVLKPRRPFNTAAADNDAKRVDKLNTFNESGIWPEIMRNVDYQGALKTASTYGANALVDGVSAREAKRATFWQKWQPFLNDHVAKIQALPADSETARDDKVIQNLHGLRKLKGKWRGITAPAGT